VVIYVSNFLSCHFCCCIQACGLISWVHLQERHPVEEFPKTA
jgi:hypothetical protein